MLAQDRCAAAIKRATGPESALIPRVDSKRGEGGGGAGAGVIARRQASVTNGRPVSWFLITTTREDGVSRLRAVEVLRAAALSAGNLGPGHLRGSRRLAPTGRAVRGVVLLRVGCSVQGEFFECLYLRDTRAAKRRYLISGRDRDDYLL